MFSELVESVSRPRDKRKKWAVAVSLALQAICLLILIVVPLIYTQALPKAIVNTALVALPGALPKPAVGAAPPRGGVRSARFFRNGVMIAPGHIPLHVNIIEEPPLPPEASMGDAISSGNSGLNLLDVAANAEEKVSRPAGPEARACDEHDGSGQADIANSAGLSAARDSGAYTRQCGLTRHHRKRRRRE